MGIFITIEGPNGVGKSTFIQELYKTLSIKSSVYLTKEPSESDFGNYVKNNENNLHGKSYAHLIAADRCYHVENYIIPNLTKYDIIICDRYIESSLVLQTYDGVDIDYVWKLNEEFPIPHISVILLAQSGTLESRLSQRSELSKFEKLLTRDLEIELYKKAYEHILTKGFKPIILSNENDDDLSKNIQIIEESVLHLGRKNSE